MKLEDFSPEVIKFDENIYGIMLVELNSCHICKKYMVVSPRKNESPFPYWIKVNFDAQLKKSGWVKQSLINVDGKPICLECAEAGKADFLCVLCLQRKPTDKIQDGIGDPTEFLCRDCYETVPAKVWEEKLESLYDKHRYDFE